VTTAKTRWDRDVLSRLRAADNVGDGAAVVRLLSSTPFDEVLQLAGDGLLTALNQGVEGAPELAARCAEELRDRFWLGDEELADELDSALGRGPARLLRTVPVRLDVLTVHLEGDPQESGARLDLKTGEVWPSGLGLLDRPEEDERAEAGRWLLVERQGSGAGYSDMELFIEQLQDERLAELLTVAIQGRGAFRRFKDALSGHPEEAERFYVVSDERQRGRARSWLAEEGYRPSVGSKTR
jgi:Uncharacterised protein family (UPF0158)